jgi:small GTP-binding protein
MTGKGVKCVMVGDIGCGKTCAVELFTSRTMPTQYSPTLNGVAYKTQVTIDNQPITLELWDTPGQADYENRRALYYPLADVVLMVFNMVDRSTLENARSKWFQEVRRHIKDVPIVLAGLQKDRVDEENFKVPTDGYVISMESHIEKIRDNIIKPVLYRTCSTLQNVGVDELFENIVQTGLKFQQENQEKLPTDWQHQMANIVQVLTRPIVDN